MNRYSNIAYSLLLLLLTACGKDEPFPSPTTPSPPASVGNITLRFENKVGANPLVLDFKDYLNPKGDSFRVSTFNYYISNIQLRAADNSIYSENESYHLIKASDIHSLQFKLAHVPLKTYTSLSFMIGVDSARNVSGAQTGVLDPALGHFWSWNSGYIMTKLEGTSPVSTAVGKQLLFHVGGFSGIHSVLKKVTLAFPTHAVVSAGVSPQVFIAADVNEWFSPNAVDFSKLNVIHMPGADAKYIADNYANMFTLTQVIN
jgi:hypothetical protein